MYDYGYGYDVYDYGNQVSSTGGILAGFGFMWFIILAVSIFGIVSKWKLYTKAGKKGWASIVPIYSNIVLIEIAGLPMWYLALLFIPFANIYAMFKIYIEIAHKFGKTTGFGVAMVFFNIICIPILAFGNAEYNGGNTSNNNTQSNMSNNNVSNTQFSMPNNNIQSTMMNVNNNTGNQSSFTENVQSQSNFFQPSGNVNNNIHNMDNSSASATNTNTNNFVNSNNVSTTAQSMNNQVNNMNKYCPACGTITDGNAMFCSNCGHNLK